jgi:MATE family, multidrug efflux pump
MKNRYSTQSYQEVNSVGHTLINDLTSGSVTRKLLLFSIPIMLANLLQVLYGLVDMVVVGKFVDSAGLSAVSNGGDIMNLTIVLCIGLSAAGQILIAQFVGSKDSAGIKKTIGTMFSFLGILSIAMTVLGIVTIDWLLAAMKVPMEARGEAKEYCVVIFLGVLFIFGYNVVSAILRGMGDSKRPLVIIAAATVLFLILDPILVKHMGVRGAAIATVIAQGTSCIGSVIYLYIKREAFGLEFRRGSFAVDGPILKVFLKLGLPIALMFGSVTISKLFVNSWINSYGVTTSAVTGIGTKIGLVASIVTSAFSTAAASMIGQNFGAGKLDRIVKIIYVSLSWGLIFTASVSVLFILFSAKIFSLFSTDPAVLAMSHKYVIIAVLNFNGFALRSPMMALINGLGNGRLNLVVGILDGVVIRIGLAMLLGLSMGMGIMGFWYGNVFAGYVPFCIGGVYFWSGIWKQHKLAIEVRKRNWTAITDEVKLIKV